MNSDSIFEGNRNEDAVDNFMALNYGWNKLELIVDLDAFTAAVRVPFAATSAVVIQ